jgi:hypothetical protein
MIFGVAEVTVYYQYFYQKKYNSPKYRFKPTPQAEKKIQIFLDLLEKRYSLETLGLNFFSNYFLFQFNRTHNQVFQRFASKAGVPGRVQIYDIIGKTAFQYWLDRNTEYDWTLRDNEFYKLNKVSLKEVESLIEAPPGMIPLTVIRSEEVEKHRFHNEPRGFLNCIEHTSLFNHRSLNCVTCKSKNDCKELLKNNYEHIYQERGYGK